MRSKAANLWDKLRSSFWFVPLAMSLAALVLTEVTLRIDQTHDNEWARKIGWIAAGSSEDARDTLSTIASSVATIAGVVFSITMVVLTLASAQFGPRVLRQFMRDGWTQSALGTFIGTFTYCILILRAMGPLQREGKVLDVSVSVSILLGLASLGVLVLFIHHVSENIQAANIVAKLNCETESVIAANFDPSSNGHKDTTNDGPGFLAEGHADIPWESTSGYIQAISYEVLVRAAEKRDIEINVLRRPGQFLICGEPIAQVRPGERLSDGIAKEITSSIEVGAQRTQSQDVEFGIEQIVQVALRALSPSLNDPATANVCIDHLASTIGYIAQRQLMSGRIRDSHGRVRVFTSISTFAGFMDAAFNEIRQSGRSQVAVVMRLIENFGRIARIVRSEEHRRWIDEHIERVMEAARDQNFSERDRADIEDRYSKAKYAVRSAARTSHHKESHAA